MSESAWDRLRPRPEDYVHPGTSLRVDVLAGVSVAIVALPLALAFGVTSGLGGRAGLITAIVAGIIAALFGGSDVQVSGPTGAMTVVLVPVVAQFGPGAVLIIGILAGLILIAAAFLRLGRSVSHIPWPVVEGFTLGIAVIIFLQQVPAFLGVAKPRGENAAAVAIRAIAHVSPTSAAAIAVGAAVIVLMLVVPRLGRALPGSLIAVAGGTFLAEALHLDVNRIGSIPSSIPLPNIPPLAGIDLRVVLGPAFAVAALAAIESLLSAKVADGMADGREHEPDRELFGQGLANLVSPLFGGMPATGAIARTAVNVRAGARSRLSALVHGVVLILAVLFLAPALKVIPLAALAGILMVTAARMVDVRAVRMLLRSTRSDAVVLVATAGATVLFDLVVAIEVGVAVAGALALRAVAKTTTFEPERVEAAAITTGDEEQLLNEHIVAYRLDGALFFGAAQRFLAELSAVADVRVVILRLGRLQVLDATGAQALGDMAQELEERGITVLLCGARPKHARLMNAVGALAGLATEDHVYDNLEAAIAHARIHALRVGNHGTEAPVQSA